MRSGLLWALLILGTVVEPVDPLPPESRVTAVKVVDLPAYSEGIVFEEDDVLFVSIRNPHEVLRLSLDGGSPHPWLSLQVPNGHKILSDGTHLVAGQGTIVHVAPDGHVLDSIVTAPTGVALRRPNDIALDGRGGFYFTDPGSTQEDEDRRRGKVYYVDRARQLRLVADSFCYPNGLVVRQDGRLLYLDDSCDNRVYAFPVLESGSLGPRQVVASLPDSGTCGPDGMTPDASGRLYIAHYGCGRVVVLSPTGQLLRRYAAGNQLASNVAFGGPCLHDLYVTGAPGEKTGPGAIYRLPLGIRGRSSRTLPNP